MITRFVGRLPLIRFFTDAVATELTEIPVVAVAAAGGVVIPLIYNVNQAVNRASTY